MAIERRVVRYFGRVQGVGFRARTRRLASGFAVAGTVRNLADGSVEVIVEGEAPEVSGFLNAIDREFSGHIRESSAELLTANDSLPAGFSIIH